MKQILLFAGLTLLLLSCKKNHTKPCPTDTYRYEVSANKKIDTLTGEQSGVFAFLVNDGSDRVFEYTHDNSQCPEIMDGGYSRVVVFEVPSDVSGFNYTDGDLRVINCYTRLSCYCNEISAHAVTLGNIQGQKLSGGKWRVKMNITITGSTEVISIDKVFNPK